MSNNSTLHNREAGATLPLMQSVITGGLVGLTVAIICEWQRVRDGLIYALITWLIVTCLTWLILQFHWFNLTSVETLTGWDIDNDGIVGSPQDEPSPRHVITLDIHQKMPGGFDRTDTARLPFTEAAMQALAAGLIRGRPFTEREFCGQGKPLSSGQFREARAEMLKRGLIEAANSKAPQRGYKLTRAGAAVMRHFAPSPTDDL